MARGGKEWYKKNTRNRARSRDVVSDDSDEDYTVAEDEALVESEDEYCESLIGDESEESLDGLVDEEEDEDEEDEFVVQEVKKKVGSRKTQRVTRGKRKNKVTSRRKKQKFVYSEEEEDDEDVNDDDDDEEFTPDEIDTEDEEEESPIARNCKKVKRPHLQKKVSRGQKRKRNSKVLNKSIRKAPNTVKRVERKPVAYNPGEFIEVKKPVPEEKSTKTSGRGRKRRRKRMTVQSDSDFVSSGSSDYEYTISEEEREQIREASKFCGDLTTNLRSSTLINKLREEAPHPQQKRLERKGKGKIEELKIESVKQVCGICLSEEGKRTVRGTLNCCSHYFCFACIMEWSKVESRCPLCKQRFTKISKPARSHAGFDLRAVEIEVPERDQVYQPSEEELRGYLDPYEGVFCTECHQGGDDALMLLCDLCDSPAHTYCVGLGREVPEGNWYCEGCRPTALASSNPQVLNPTPDGRASNHLVGSSPVASVRESFDLNELYVPDTPLGHDNSYNPSPRYSVGDVLAASPSSGSGAYTVLERRRLQRHIHQMINNRMRQQGRTIGRLSEVPVNSILLPQVHRSCEFVPQHTSTPNRAPSYNTFFQGRSLDNNMPILQDRNISSERLTDLVMPANENQASSSVNRSYGGLFPSDINTRFSLGLGNQQLQPCSSTSNVASEADTSPFTFREPTVPSSTLQGALHTPF